mmetsp:Transcript_57597/g.160442  ORF Transcript_57597/g.160442 Transcript_57597/m.160442 type:complete len:203 (+) Transcript_57597:198-806(+)
MPRKVPSSRLHPARQCPSHVAATRLAQHRCPSGGTTVGARPGRFSRRAPWDVNVAPTQRNQRGCRSSPDPWRSPRSAPTPVRDRPPLAAGLPSCPRRPPTRTSPTRRPELTRGRWRRRWQMMTQRGHLCALGESGIAAWPGSRRRMDSAHRPLSRRSLPRPPTLDLARLRTTPSWRRRPRLRRAYACSAPSSASCRPCGQSA